MSFKACASIDKIFSFPSRSSTHSCVKCDFAYVTIFFTGSYLPCTYQKLKMAHTLGGRIWLVCWNFQRCNFFVLMQYMLWIFVLGIPIGLLRYISYLIFFKLLALRPFEPMNFIFDNKVESAAKLFHIIGYIQ